MAIPHSPPPREFEYLLSCTSGPFSTSISDAPSTVATIVFERVGGPLFFRFASSMSTRYESSVVLVRLVCTEIIAGRFLLVSELPIMCDVEISVSLRSPVFVRRYTRQAMMLTSTIFRVANIVRMGTGTLWSKAMTTVTKLDTNVTLGYVVSADFQ